MAYVKCDAQTYFNWCYHEVAYGFVHQRVVSETNFTRGVTFQITWLVYPSQKFVNIFKYIMLIMYRFTARKSILYHISDYLSAYKASFGCILVNHMLNVGICKVRCSNVFRICIVAKSVIYHCATFTTTLKYKTKFKMLPRIVIFCRWRRTW